MATKNTTAKINSLRITDEDWDSMCDRRDKLDEDVENFLTQKKVRMAAIALNERKNLSASLKKTHNMRERDRLAGYRKRLDDLKTELGISSDEVASTEADVEADEGAA